jgi:Holliday junction resolvase YEN1
MFVELAHIVSLWMHGICAVFQINHAAAGKSPELRTLFFRLRTLLKLPLHAVFVFDGLGRLPDKGHKVRSSPHWLTRDFQRMLDLFGFHWTKVRALPS